MTYDKNQMSESLLWSVGELLEASEGDFICGRREAVFDDISIDSRKIERESLFVAIKGDRHDGHFFIKDVLKKGVHGLIIEKDKMGEFDREKWRNQNLTCIAVDNTTKFLGDIAAYRRKKYGVSVVAITGSNGKTTTRKMVSNVISERYMTLSTTGNLNNQIGVPLTLFKLRKHHEWAVLELGMNHLGEIKRLTEICMPDIGLVTNIGPSHLEGVGSIEGVVSAKGELLENMKQDGHVALNADDSNSVVLARKHEKNMLFFGMSKHADIKAAFIEEKDHVLSFTLMFPAEEITVDLKVPGIFMVSNALAAASVGYLLGLSGKEIKAGLEKFTSVKGRMNIVETGMDLKIIDDTYNANPLSIEAALKTLSSLRGNNRGVFVMGDMLELGEHAAVLHGKMGAMAANSGIKKLYVTGEFAEYVLQGALDEKMNSKNVFVGSKDKILEKLKQDLRKKDWILIKGSRGMAMEEVVNGLKEWADG